jgi:hypothetical protein
MDTSYSVVPFFPGLQKAVNHKGLENFFGGGIEMQRKKHPTYAFLEVGRNISGRHYRRIPVRIRLPDNPCKRSQGWIFLMIVLRRGCHSTVDKTWLAKSVSWLWAMVFLKGIRVLSPG